MYCIKMCGVVRAREVQIRPDCAVAITASTHVAQQTEQEVGSPDNSDT